MPELPEVEGFRKYLEATSLKKKITAISHTDHKTIRGDVSVFEEMVAGQSFVKTKRIGKYLFLKLSGKSGWVVVHCGMTGSFEQFKELDLLPKHTRILFHFEDGFHLAFNDPRKFGKVEWTPDVEQFRKAKKLGTDMLELDQEGFIKILLRKKGMIKPLLMNQSYFPGIGNWIADDALFQAQIHPETLCQDLKLTDFLNLYEKIQHCIKVAIDLECDYDNFPKGFLVNLRKGGEECPRKNGTLQRIEVGGRGTYFCPACQPQKSS